MEQDVKKIKQQEEAEEKVVKASHKASYQCDELDYLECVDDVDYDVESDTWDTYILCEKNQKNTGWFYPDEDDEEELDDILYESEDY